MARERKRTARLGRGLSSLMAQPAKVNPSPPEVAPPPEADADFAESSVNGASDGVATARPAPAPAEPVGHGEGLHYLSVKAIRPNPHQPRQHFDEQALQRLADSIKADGLMQPIVVRPRPGQRGDADTPWELVAGERRWRAAQLARLDTVPAIVRQLDDRQLAEWALIENLQREDLNPLERAEAFQRLIETFQLSHDDIAARVGVDRSSVSNLLRLLALDENVQALVREGKLSMGQARALAGLTEPAMQRRLAEQAVKQDLSVRQVEQRVRELRDGQGAPVPDESASGRRVRSAYLADLEQQIVEQLQTKVRIRPGRKKGSGTLTIEFYSLDQFDSLLGRLGVETE